MKTYKKKKKKAGVNIKKPSTNKKETKSIVRSKSIKKTRKEPISIAIQRKDFFLEDLFNKCSNFKDLGKTNVNEFFINKKFEIPYARKIMGDFVTLLRKEGIDPKKNNFNEIGKTIQEDCFNNFQNSDRKCFCCGEDIKFLTRDDGKIEPIDVACDHVIPVINMLLTVQTNSISKNLQFIHKNCNGKKSDKNIYETYDNVGKKNGIFKCRTDNSKYCQSKFLDILKNLDLRSPADIDYRISNIDNFRNFIDEFKEYINFFLNDKVSATTALLKMRNTIPKNSLSRSRSSVGSSTRSSSRSSSRNRN